MHCKLKIDILYISNQVQILKWDLGDIIYIGDNLSMARGMLKDIIPNNNSDYVFCINIDLFTLPFEEIIINIIKNKPGEVWHLGLKCNYQSLPNVLNYVHPLWLYNLDADKEISSTSWRVSAECFLAKTEILMKTFLYDSDFETNTMLGLDWGFRLYKAGVILRYEPMLSEVKTQEGYSTITLNDELHFIKRNFSKKWYFWVCFRLWKNKFPLGDIIKAHVKNRNNHYISVNYVRRNSEDTNIDLSQYKVSVFTPTLSRYSYLKNELNQLRNQTIKPAQIIITDQTRENQRKQNWLRNYKDLNILYQPQNEMGQCNAWNFCLENAIHDYVLFLGDDADEIDATFIEELLRTMISQKANMVACNIKEQESGYPFKQHDIFITDIFPICLVKKEIFQSIGGYDYAFNKGSRADGDVAVRMHLNGALMVLNPNITVHHHRAPVGGLRTHGQRTVTRFMSKKSIRHFQLPSYTEIYLSKRYYTRLQQDEMIAIKKISFMSIDGNLFKKLAKITYYLYNRRFLSKQLRELNNMSDLLFEKFPEIPLIR